MRDVNENLGGQLAAATQMSEHLKRQLAEGDHVVRRLTKIAIAARPTRRKPGESPHRASRRAGLPRASGGKALERQGVGGGGSGILRT